MSQIFLSHSSKNKAIVRRVACDLLGAGLPVWFDEWDMRIGDSLVDRIYNAVEDGSAFILFISKESIESDWVNREMKAALEIEKRSGKTILYPVKIDDCYAPLPIADRIYADFSESYRQPLDKLIARLRAASINLSDLNANLRIPLSFVKEIDLKSDNVTNILARLRALDGFDMFRFSSDNFILVDGEKYQFLIKKAYQRFDNLEKDKYYSESFLNSFSNYMNSLGKMEGRIKSGVEFICNTYYNLERNDLHMFEISQALSSYCRIQKSYQLYRAWMLQNPDDPDKVERDTTWRDDHLGTSASSFELENVAKIDVGPSSDGMSMMKSFGVWVDPEESIYQNTNMHGYCIIDRLDRYSADVIGRYVVPRLAIEYAWSEPGEFDQDFMDLPNLWVGRG